MWRLLSHCFFLKGPCVGRAAAGGSTIAGARLSCSLFKHSLTSVVLCFSSATLHEQTRRVCECVCVLGHPRRRDSKQQQPTCLQSPQSSGLLKLPLDFQAGDVEQPRDVGLQDRIGLRRDSNLDHTFCIYITLLRNIHAMGRERLGPRLLSRQAVS